MISRLSKYIEVNPRNIPVNTPDILRSEAVLYIPDLVTPVDGKWVDRSGRNKQVLAATTNVANDSLIMPANDADIIGAVTKAGLYSQFYTNNSTPKTVVISEITAANQFNNLFFDSLTKTKLTLFNRLLDDNNTEVQQMYDFTFVGYRPVWQTSDTIQVLLNGSGTLSIDWGDGNSNIYVLNFSNTTVSHTYTTLIGKTKNIRCSGNYTITSLDSQYSDGRTNFGCRISNLTSLTYLRWYGNNTGTGSVSILTSLIYLSWGGSNTSDKILRVNNHPSLCYFALPVNNTYTSTEINQLLADFWGNKDAPKTRSERVINLQAAPGTQAPTGQGLIDKAALAAYRSPNNLPQYALWTVTTR